MDHGTRAGVSLLWSAIQQIVSLVTYVSIVSTLFRDVDRVIYRPCAGHFGLMDVLETPSTGNVRVPSIVFCVFQMMFATITYVHPHRTTVYPN
jgi:hypothetical protein